MQPLATFPAVVPYHVVFSFCGRHRYDWANCWADGPCVVFIGLNPSHAEGIASLMRSAGGGVAVRIVNLFSWIDTDPAAMKLAAEPAGPRNDHHLLARAADADLIIAVWSDHGFHLGRDQVVKRILKGRLHALAINKDGSPSHPLYLRKDLSPFPYP